MLGESFSYDSNFILCSLLVSKQKMNVIFKMWLGSMSPFKGSSIWSWRRPCGDLPCDETPDARRLIHPKVFEICNA